MYIMMMIMIIIIWEAGREGPSVLPILGVIVFGSMVWQLMLHSITHIMRISESLLSPPSGASEPAARSPWIRCLWIRAYKLSRAVRRKKQIN